MGIWNSLFVIVTYTAFAACLYTAYKKGFTQLLVLLLFLFLYWLLESYGNHRVPLYHYPPGLFPNMIPHFDWSSVSWAPPPIKFDCLCNPNPDYDAVPLAVLFLEASLTFSVMWTARQLTANLTKVGPYLQPFMVAMVLLAVDALLDPLASISRDCMREACTQRQLGLGFWEWFVREDLGLEWLGLEWFAYDIPLFNHSLWYAGPVAAVALVNILGWIERAISYMTGSSSAPPMPSALELIFLLIIVFAFLVIIVMSPAAIGADPVVQNAILLLLVVATIILIIVFSPDFAHGQPFEWYIAYPAIAVSLFNLAVFLLAGFTLLNLWILVILLIPAVVGYALSPYL